MPELVQPETYTIKKWSPKDRPREKMLAQHSGILDNAELLALLIGSGHKQATALDLAKQILRTFDNDLNILAQKSPQELRRKFKGIGEAKATTIMAGFELGRRLGSISSVQKPQITTSMQAFEILKQDLLNKPYEMFQALLLSRSNQLLRKITISEGGVNETSADPKKIFKMALDEHCSHIILGHNHPSGNIQPSEEDMMVTKRLYSAGKMLDMLILDHIIVGQSNMYYSFADERCMPN